MSETGRAKRKHPATGAAGGQSKAELRIGVQPGKSDARNLAEIALEPAAQAMATTMLFNRGSFGKIEATETYEVLHDSIKLVTAGDLSHHRALLAGQAIALNSIFTEMSRRSALNMGEYLQASETYMRLALKAQAQSRATIEALDRLANGREQTVRHVHVNEGGQAVIADQFHHHTGGMTNAETADQSQGTATGAAGVGPALPGADPFGNGVPIPSREGEAALQNARRD